MAHYERNLESSEACGGDRGVYVARTYFVDGQQTKMKQIDLGHFSHELETVPDIITETAERLGRQLGMKGAFPVDGLVAAGILRECQRRRHQDGKQADSARLERLGSFIIARSNFSSEPIKLAPTKQQRRVSEHGFGNASRPGFTPIQNMVYLPTTKDEDGIYEITRAQQAGPFSSTLSKQPFVALHSLSDESKLLEHVQQGNYPDVIEHILHLDELL